MRCVRLVYLMALGVCACLTTAASSATIILHHNTSQYSSGTGGEFRATLVGLPGVVEQAAGVKVSNPSAPVGAVVFQTFCMETNEFLTPGTTYYVQLNTAAINGGAGGSLPNGDPISGGPGDPLDPMTAYLFTRFSDGTLAGLGYNYTLGAARSASAAALQNAIWYIEQEISGPLSGLALTFYNDAWNAVHGANPTWSGLGNVRVLNLYADQAMTQRKQDQLALIEPSFGNPVPLPSAAWAAATLLMALTLHNLHRRLRA
jgi:hypothetical protein